MPLKLQDVKVGDYVYSDATGKTIRKVVQISESTNDVLLWSEKKLRSTRITIGDFERFWSIGKCSKRFNFDRF
jgi:hypothetical protein